METLYIDILLKENMGKHIRIK